jgi:hypothetical protein
LASVFTTDHSENDFFNSLARFRSRITEPRGGLFSEVRTGLGMAASCRWVF